MPPKISCKKNVFTGFIISALIINVFVLLSIWDILYAGLVLTWVAMMFYCLNHLTKRIALFCFGLAFFTFLMGRDGMIPFLNQEHTSYTREINNHAYISMELAIIGVWLTFMIFSHTQSKHDNVKTLSSREIIWYSHVRKYSIISFYIVYPFAILVNLAIGYFVIKYGYAAKFTDLRALVENTPIFYTISKIELLLPASFSIFMATLPSKKQFMKIVKPYFIYLILTLLTGGRGDFIMGILLIIIGMAFMQKIEPDITWISKNKTRKLLLVGVPIIAIGGSIMNIVRFGGSTDEVSLSDSFVNFFYDQGVSVTTIKNAYKYEESIPKQDDLYILEFLHTGLLARLLGNPVYQGNTIEHATKGGSFTHSLGYAIMGEVYLSGRGTGTSYIAELYYDLGYIGVFLGSCLYGFLFSLMSSLSKTGLFSRSIIFIILTKLLWAPRGGYSLFLGFLFAPTTLALLLFVFGAAQISYVRELKLKNTNYYLYNENINLK